jgi:hypothetical protein
MRKKRNPPQDESASANLHLTCTRVVSEQRQVHDSPIPYSFNAWQYNAEQRTMGRVHS